MSALADALDDGIAAPARLRDLLGQELQRGAAELERKRSGYDDPVVVAFGTCAEDGALAAALPVATTFRADAAVIEERAWRVVAAAVGALQQACELPPPATPEGLKLTAADLGGHLTLTLGAPGDPMLAQIAFDEALQSVDRLRAHAVALPDALLDPDDAKPPIGPTHPLRVAEAVARLQGDPADPDEETERQVLTLLEPRSEVARPHDDPDPAKRVARRILQRLDGMGKWGGYHTDFAHLARGFAGNDRSLADAVGEALIDAELLSEKPSVGQRHVFLNPRKAGEIRRMIESGEVPPALRLPSK
ncbi:MAG TPA: hypothetical protein VN238_03010 [Solirubrobacteraceae bacterium]|nr:hypothetical protein [Solirubrobacteraceae bacterium]